MFNAEGFIGSWERHSKYPSFNPYSLRKTKIARLTPMGEFITKLIADDLKSNRQIRWERVLKKLPPDGVGLGYDVINKINISVFTDQKYNYLGRLSNWKLFLKEKGNVTCCWEYNSQYENDNNIWEGKTVQFIIDDCMQTIDLLEDQISALKVIDALEALDLTAAPDGL